MPLLKTKFYPVDPSRQIIYLDPLARERDVAHKWGRGKHVCVGLRGAHLLKHQCYSRYSFVPTVTVEQLVQEWTREKEQSRYLWNGAATEILRTLGALAPSAALAHLESTLSRCRGMAISVYYQRVVRDLQECLRQQSIADARSASLLAMANASAT